jgi:hypothetical protein
MKQSGAAVLFVNNNTPEREGLYLGGNNSYTSPSAETLDDEWRGGISWPAEGDPVRVVQWEKNQLYQDGQVDKFDRKYLDKYIEKHTVKARGVAPAATEEAA